MVSKFIHSLCTLILSIDGVYLLVSNHTLNKWLRISEETHNNVHKDGCRYADRPELQNMLWGFFCEDSFHQIVHLFHFVLKKKIQNILEVRCHFVGPLHMCICVCVC